MTALLSVALLACGAPNPAGPREEPIHSIEVINAGLDSLAIGAETQLSAVARSASGQPVPGASIAWESSTPAVAVVTNGRVTAVAAGQAMITARASNGVIGGRMLRVLPAPIPVWDLDSLGIPRIVTADYIESFRIRRVSYFRSGFGHDYSDAVESCRSMKHYFVPSDMATADQIQVFAPFAGTVSRVMEEQSFGTQVQIRSAANPAFTAILFHLRPDQTLEVGHTVAAGERLGRHFGAETASDVALQVNTPTGTRLISYFDALSDAVWTARYATRGAAARSSFIHSRAARDATPLMCDTIGTFVGEDALPKFVELLSGS